MVCSFARSLAGNAFAAYVVAEHMPRALRSAENPLVTAGFTALGSVLGAVLETPVDYVEGYAVERRYGLTDQSSPDWLRDRIKMTAVTTAITTPLIAGLLFAARRFPRTWPGLATASVPPVLAVLTLAGPVFIAPLFNRFEPLRDGQGRTIETRLRTLASRYGVGDAEIVRFDMSRQSKKANAYVAGLFRTHRIAVADTLLANFTDDEIEFVVAHELGHYVAHDTWIGVAAGSIASAALINGAFALSRSSDQNITTIGGFARFSFALQLLAAAVVPLLAAGSRTIERRADRFALAATRQPAWGITAFERLRDQNLAEDEEPAWAEVLVATHPSLKSRISALREATV